MLLTLVRLLSRWPLGALHALGAGLGWVGYAVSGTYRRRLKAHAQLAGISASDRRASVAEAGKMTVELARLWGRPADTDLTQEVTLTGTEHVEAALAAGRGLILLTPHLGSFEVSAQAYAQRFGQRSPITVLYRPAKQAALRTLEEAARARPGLATAPASLAGVRQMLRALKAGQTVGLLPDQVPPQGQGVWVPFFGQPAYTMTLAAKLARQTGAAVVSAWCERLPWGRGFVLNFLPLDPALPPVPSPGSSQAEEAWLTQATAGINQAMEGLILRRPAQYLWGYHRYKQPRQDA